MPGSARKILVYHAKLVRESESMSSENAGVAATVLFPGGEFIKKNKKVVDTINNNFQVPLAHAHSSVLKAAAQQQDIQLEGELAPCFGCSMAK